MIKKDVKVGAVLAWMSRYTLDQRSQDGMSEPVRIIDLHRERPVYANGRRGPQTGTRKVIIGIRLDPVTLEPWPEGHMRNGEVEIEPKFCTGPWNDRVERMAARRMEADAAQARAEARLAEHRATWAEARSLFVRPPTFTASLNTSGRITMSVDDFLAALKSARTQALDEMEGTGGRNV